ncbi:MAG: carbohydrate-binding domain-containing protein [Ruminococcus sp.]|jgi:hypothetical protein|nr:carbohydrate-binding domain-containing protein [Ruminococcus sp.]
MNKKTISVILSVLFAGILTGCNAISAAEPENINLAEKPAVTTTAAKTPVSNTITFSAAEPEITITKGGSYTVTGSVKNGRLIISAGNEAVTLTFKDADITSERGPALRIRSAKSVEVVLPKDTDSFLTSSTRDDDSAAIASNAELTISGEGSLTLSSNGSGIDTNKVLNMKGGSLTVSKSEEGIEAAEVNVTDGNITITSREDGINALRQYSQSGGRVYIDCGGEGLDSRIYVSGGSLIIEGTRGLPIEFEREFEITGGTIFTTGSTFGSGRNVFPTGGDQTFVAANVSAGIDDVISVKDSKGNDVASLVAAKKTSVIFVSNAALKAGETYTITVTDSETETTAATVKAGEKPATQTSPRYDDDDDWDDRYDDDYYDDDRYDWDD